MKSWHMVVGVAVGLAVAVLTGAVPEARAVLLARLLAALVLAEPLPDGLKPSGSCLNSPPPSAPVAPSRSG